MTHLQLADGSDGMGNWFTRQIHNVENAVTNSAPARRARKLRNYAQKRERGLINTGKQFGRYALRNAHNAAYINPVFRALKGADFVIRNVNGRPVHFMKHHNTYLPLSDGLESRFGRWVKNTSKKGADFTAKNVRKVAQSRIGQLIQQYGPDALSLIPGGGSLALVAKYGSKGIKALNAVNKGIDIVDNVQGLTRVPAPEAQPDAPTDMAPIPEPSQQFYPTAQPMPRTMPNYSAVTSAMRPASSGFDTSSILPVAGGLLALYLLTRKSK
jgi:hypothetical protein